MKLYKKKCKKTFFLTRNNLSIKKLRNFNDRTETGLFLNKGNLSFAEMLRMKCLLKIFYLYKKTGKNIKFLNADKKMFEKFLKRNFTDSKKLDAVIGLKDHERNRHYHRVKKTFLKQNQFFVSIEPKTSKNKYENFTYHHDEYDNRQQQFYFKLFSSFNNRK